MAAILEHDYSLQATGRRVNIPNDNIGRLMYYLNCVNKCIGEELPNELTDFTRCYQLGDPEKLAVVLFSVLLSPDELMGKVFFPLPDNHPLLNGSTNEFYKLTDRQTLSAIAPAGGSNFLMLQGKQVQTTNFMVFSMAWLQNFFLNPIKAEIWRLEKAKREQEEAQQRQQRIAYQPQYQGGGGGGGYQRQQSDDCCCVIL